MTWSRKKRRKITPIYQLKQNMRAFKLAQGNGQEKDRIRITSKRNTEIIKVICGDEQEKDHTSTDKITPKWNKITNKR